MTLGQGQGMTLTFDTDLTALNHFVGGMRKLWIRRLQ